MPEAHRRIVITGVTSGLGQALARFYAAAGHTVYGCGRRAEPLAALRAELPTGRFATVDVTAPAAVESWCDDLLAEGGAPDLVINNAAIINRNAPLWLVPSDEFSRLVDVNIKGVYQVIRSLLPSMIARGQGVVVNFSSGWGRSTSPDVAPYCASKWAIEGLSAALAQELPRGLAVVAYNPGIIDTPMLRSCFGPAAARSPDPERWAADAAPLLLSLGPRDNGRAL